MIVKTLRKNIGTIIAALGFLLLCITTFGNLGEFMTDAYWENVKNNMTSIGFLTIALVLIQISIKQGLAEQALQTGLNTENTAKKYEEHKAIIVKNKDRMVYLPYFLQVYNKRHTALRKREFLIDNNFSSEKALLATKDVRLINKYNNIKVMITAGRIKWATTDISYNKYGQIVTLQEHRAKRVTSAIFTSLVFMLGVTLLTRGLFFSASEEPLWQKFVKLFTCVIAIAMSSTFSVIKEYEKGAFGVPNDLDEINEIWNEFTLWEVPEWVTKEIDELNEGEEVTQNGEERKDTVEGRADLQDKQKTCEVIPNTCTSNLVLAAGIDRYILHTDDTELSRKCDRDTQHA